MSGRLAIMDGMGDRVYYSERTERSRRRSLQRRKKALVAFLGLAAVLGGGSYGVTTWLAARESITTLTDAFGPVTASSSAARPHPSTKRPKKTPAPGPAPATKSAARQQYRPSPTPTPTSTLTDDQIAAVQVGHLLERPHAAGSMAAASAVTVTDETAADGSLIRVVSARHDLTGRWESLWAADPGRPVGTARCTQNFRINGGSYAEVRPGMLLCWRTSAAKSVVTVATVRAGRPSTAASVAVVEREWSRIH
jgi:hypothetical protein